jgi:chromosome segregation ATPase
MVTYYSRNKERVKEYHHQRYPKIKEKVKEYNHKYYESHTKVMKNNTKITTLSQQVSLLKKKFNDIMNTLKGVNQKIKIINKRDRSKPIKNIADVEKHEALFTLTFD